jgi:hypothetical protein
VSQFFRNKLFCLQKWQGRKISSNRNKSKVHPFCQLTQQSAASAPLVSTTEQGKKHKVTRLLATLPSSPPPNWLCNFYCNCFCT